jgi:hypothetical protein
MEYVEITLAVFGLISLIVRATPTPKDDEILNPILKALNMIFNSTRTKK